LEDVPACRVLEVPLWMLDVAACCKIRASKPASASAQSLRVPVTHFRGSWMHAGLFDAAECDMHYPESDVQGTRIAGLTAGSSETPGRVLRGRARDERTVHDQGLQEIPVHARPGGSLNPQTANLTARRCTRPAFPCDAAAKDRTLSSHCAQ